MPERSPVPELVITAAKRTAIGAFQGSLKDLSAADLGVVAVQAIFGVGANGLASPASALAAEWESPSWSGPHRKQVQVTVLQFCRETVRLRQRIVRTAHSGALFS